MGVFEEKKETCGTICLKYLLFAFNFLFWVSFHSSSLELLLRKAIGVCFLSHYTFILTSIICCCCFFIICYKQKKLAGKILSEDITKPFIIQAVDKCLLLFQFMESKPSCIFLQRAQAMHSKSCPPHHHPHPQTFQCQECVVPGGKLHK